MSADTPITRDNLNDCLKALAKEFRRLNGTKTQAEIVLIGGAAILVSYPFRDLTYDVDAIIIASSAMKEAINTVGDRLNLPRGWLNADFKRTASYSDKLIAVSVYYKTFSNILQVRTIAAEYLVAMKLMSGRRYKHDISDVYGILWEHQKNGTPLTKESVLNAIEELFGSASKLPEASAVLLDDAFKTGDYEKLYKLSRKDELEAKEILTDFDQQYPNTLKLENIDGILDRMKQKKDNPEAKPSLLGRLEDAKTEAAVVNDKTKRTSKKRNGKSR